MQQARITCQSPVLVSANKSAVCRTALRIEAVSNSARSDRRAPDKLSAARVSGTLHGSSLAGRMQPVQLLLGLQGACAAVTSSSAASLSAAPGAASQGWSCDKVRTPSPQVRSCRSLAEGELGKSGGSKAPAFHNGRLVLQCLECRHAFCCPPRRALQENADEISACASDSNWGLLRGCSQAPHCCPSPLRRRSLRQAAKSGIGAS